MKIFDAHISGSLSVSSSAEISNNLLVSGNLTVVGVISGSISGGSTNADTASFAPKYTLTSSFNTFTSSASGRLTSLESESGSIRTDFNLFTISNNATNTTQNSKLTSIEGVTGSISSLNTYTGSNNTVIGTLQTSTGSLNTFTSSASGRLTSLESTSSSIRLDFNSFTSSYNTVSGSINNRLGSLESFSGSYTGSFSGSFKGDGINLFNIPASGVTGLNLTRIADGAATASISNTNGLRVNSNTEITGALTISGSISLNGVPVGTGKLDETTFNSYTSSNDSTNSTQNSRLISIESTTSSLNIFSGSIDTTIKNKLNTETVISGSVQVLLTGTTGYSTFSSSVSTSIGSLSSSVTTTTSGLSSSIGSLSSSVATTTLGLSSSFSSSIGSLSSSVATTTLGLSSSVATTTLNLKNRVDSIETSTGSLNTFTGSINTTIKSKLDAESVISGSVQILITGTTGYSTFSSSIATTTSGLSSSIGSLSSSIATTDSNQDGKLTSLESYTGSNNTVIGTLQTSTSSLNTYTSSNTTNINAIHTSTGSFKSFTSSFDTAIGLSGADVTVKGNFTVSGTSTTVNSTTVEIGDNIIQLNGTGATNAGLVVRDATAPNTVSGSLLWDSTNDNWVAGALGSEQRLVRETEFNNAVTRIGNVESSTGSLNSFTSSINTTIKNRLNTEGVLSGSVQVNHNATTNYVANQHIDHTAVSITAGSGLTGGGDISTTRTINIGAGNGITVNADDIAIDTASATFTTGVKTKLNTDTVMSGSYLGTATTANLSENASYLYYTDARVKTKLNAEGVVSGSSQITLSSTTGFGTYLNQALLTTSTPTFSTVSATTFTGALSGNATTATTAGALTSMNISQFTNNSAYLTGITSGNVTTALGFTPYNATNPSGYISSYTETSTLQNVITRGATTNTGFVIENGNSTYSTPASTNVPVIYMHNTSSNENAHAVLALRTLGPTGGDPFVSFDINGVLGWTVGVDNSDADKFKIGKSWATVGTNTYFTIDTSGNSVFAGTISASNFSGTSSGTNTGDQTSVSGNAGTVTNATFYRQFTVRDDRSDGNDYSLANRPTGLYAITSTGTNGPGSTYSSLIHVANGTDVAFQIAGGYTSDNMYFRGTSALQNGTGYSAWRTVIHSGNIGSQTVATAGALSSMNISQFTNNSGYITSYTETDTLATVTGRGASTSTAISINNTLTVTSGRVIARTGGVNTYGVFSGYDNNNHMMAFRSAISGPTSSPTFTAGHQTTFIEYAEANDTTGWFFKSSSSGTYEDIVRITRTGITPGSNGTLNLGSSSARWNTLFTSDLSLSNGIGDYTIVEGENDLFLYNNKQNKVYKFMLQEVNPNDATPKRPE
jgi:hypothetical protein